MNSIAIFTINFLYFINSQSVSYQFFVEDLNNIFPNVNFSNYWLAIYLSFLITITEFFTFRIYKNIQKSDLILKQYIFIYHSTIHLFGIAIVSLTFRLIGHSRKEIIYLITFLTIITVIIERYNEFRFNNLFRIISILISAIIITNYFDSNSPTSPETLNIFTDYKDCKYQYLDKEIDTQNNGKFEKKFYVVGHSYGNPSGDNLALQPSLLKYFENKDLTDASLILTGDLVRNYSYENLLIAKNQIELLFENYYIVPGNHDVELGNAFYEIFEDDFFSLEINDTLLIGANFNTPNWLPTVYHQNLINDLINTTDKKEIYLFSHQVFWYDQFPDEQIVNSFALLESTTNPRILTDWLDIKEKKLTIISGDSGAWGQKPFCKVDFENNITYIANGIGNMQDDTIIELIFSKNNNFELNFVRINS